MKVNSLVSFFKNRKGAIFIEAAFILPILLLLCLAGINISLYLVSVSTTNKTADLLAATLSTAEKYDSTTDVALVTAAGQRKYLTQDSLGRLIHEVVPAMMNNTPANLQARVIVTSYKKQASIPPTPATQSWQCSYDFPAAAAPTTCPPVAADRVFGPSVIIGGSLVTPVRTAVANMLDGEGMIVVEVYQRFVPPINVFNLPVVGQVPMIGESVTYSSGVYPARSGQLNCLHPNPTPYGAGANC